MFYAEKQCFSSEKWKHLLVFSPNHNYESWWRYSNWFHQKAYKFLHHRAFVVLEYLFNLWKIFRDLERNGIQNAICVPGVNSSFVILKYKNHEFSTIFLEPWLQLLLKEVIERPAGKIFLKVHRGTLLSLMNSKKILQDSRMDFKVGFQI